MQKPRFLERGETVSFPQGTILSSLNPEKNKVWYVISGAVSYKIHFPNGSNRTFDCPEGELAGMVEVCSSFPSGGEFQIEVCEDSILYGWTREQFSISLGIYQELAVQVIRKLSLILREVNSLINQG